MTTDYEKFYKKNRHGLGEPTIEFVAFFDAYDRIGVKVLDVGCGQGRDTLFIARLGHDVTAIDSSPSGIRDIEIDAANEGLHINTQVIDIRDYESESKFDIILIDRSLHMLPFENRKATLTKLLSLARQGTYLLIADQKKNITEFKNVLEKSVVDWSVTLDKSGFLFAYQN